MKYVTKLDSKVAYRQYDLCCKGTIDQDTPTHWSDKPNSTNHNHISKRRIYIYIYIHGQSWEEESNSNPSWFKLLIKQRTKGHFYHQIYPGLDTTICNSYQISDLSSPWCTSPWGIRRRRHEGWSLDGRWMHGSPSTCDHISYIFYDWAISIWLHPWLWKSQYINSVSCS